MSPAGAMGVIFIGSNFDLSLCYFREPNAGLYFSEKNIP